MVKCPFGMKNLSYSTLDRGWGESARFQMIVDDCFKLIELYLQLLLPDQYFNPQDILNTETTIFNLQLFNNNNNNIFSNTCTKTNTHGYHYKALRWLK